MILLKQILISFAHRARSHRRRHSERFDYFFSMSILMLSSSFSQSQIGVGILLTWGRTVYREFELLAGKSAPNDFLKLLTYNAMTFSEDIEKVDTVRAYHVRLRSCGFYQHSPSSSEWLCASLVIFSGIKCFGMLTPMLRPAILR